MKSKRLPKALKIILICLLAIVVLIVSVLWFGTVTVYKENFDVRITSEEKNRHYVSEYDGLSRTQYQFKSNKEQLLTGYSYSSKKAPANVSPKAIVVMAHGFGGGGHTTYMDFIEYFARKGFLVFAYDATGNDESQGLGKNDGVGGLPQGIIDLDYAITFVEKSGNFPELPIVLCGHSWGGYSVVNVLNYHPEVKAVAEIAGFVSSGDMFLSEGKNMAGDAVYAIMPFFYIHEFFKYGKYSFSTGVKGIKKSDARVMVIHGTKDDMVPVEYGYDIYYKAFKDTPRVSFMLYEDMAHDDILRSKEKTSPNTQLLDTIIKMFEEVI